jgi:mRNA interferase RelE/StbE
MRFNWPDSARAELRAIDREAALEILQSLTRYFNSGEGNLKALRGQFQGLVRLRVGDYRVLLEVTNDEATVVKVGHRSDVYR